MLNSDLLRDKITESGLKKSFIAEKLGITTSGFYLKENGKNEFTASEIKALRELLSLSDKDTKTIFFAL